MQGIKTRLSAMALMLALIAPVIAACSSGQATRLPAAPTAKPAPNDGGLLEVDPSKVTGNITAAGSSTVFPLTRLMAERFRKDGFTGDIEVYSIGTGAGFERFCKVGETDIVNASRPIQPVELDQCLAIGRHPIAFQVGVDALVVVVNKENTFVESLTRAQLAQIFSGQARTWKDVDPSWPAEPIKPFSPGSDTSAFDFFVNVVMDPAFEGKGREILLIAPWQPIIDPTEICGDEGVIQCIEKDPNAISFFAHAYLAAEKNRRWKAVKIEGVELNNKTAESGEYPLARPLFIYSDARIMKEKPQVAAFINFYLTFVNEEIENIGCFPASQRALNEARLNLLGAMKP